MLYFGTNCDVSASAPAGIYVISDTSYYAGEVERINVPQTSGLSLRVLWTDIEGLDPVTGEIVYDFSRIIRALEELRAINTKTTLEIFINKVPDYILSMDDTVTWYNPHPSFGGLQVVPWDLNAFDAYYNMLEALSNQIVAGTEIRVADHPSLSAVDAPILGLQGIRELSGELVRHPDYTRGKFIDAVVATIELSREIFSKQYGFVAIFGMDDLDTINPLDEELFANLMSYFNAGTTPQLGFFQETLSDIGPTPTALGSFLAQASDSTYILFQVLRPWQERVDTPPPPEIASGSPLLAISQAWQDYGATYVELYQNDVLDDANRDGLIAWDSFFHEISSARSQNWKHRCMLTRVLKR